MSAMSNLAGLYPPVSNQVWNPNLEWQPIPVHTLPEIEDNLLSTKAYCPRFEELKAQLLSSNPEIQAINDKYAWVYNYTAAMSGARVNFSSAPPHLKRNIRLFEFRAEVYQDTVNIF